MRHGIRIPPRFVPYLMLAPALAFIFAFILYPLGLNFYTSFQHRVFTEPSGNRFVGLANYVSVATDPTFWLVLRQSAVWVTGSLAFQFLLGLALALLLNERFPARGLYRSLILSPWAISGVIIAIMWKWMYNPQVGVLNEILVRLGLTSHRLAFLADPSTALPAVIATNIWRGTPFFAVMLLAALQAVPKELYEAGEIDGTAPLQRFRFITLPMLRNLFMICSLLSMVFSLGDFVIIRIMTGGAPGDSTHVLATLAYRYAFQMGNVDWAVGTFMTALPITLLFIFILMRWVK